MSEVVRLRTRAEIDEEAATWTWRLDSGALTPEDQRAFETWLRQDPRHRRVMEELSKVWGAMDQLASSKFSDRHNAIGDGQSDHPVIRARRPTRRQGWWFA